MKKLTFHELNYINAGVFVSPTRSLTRTRGVTALGLLLSMRFSGRTVSTGGGTQAV